MLYADRGTNSVLSVFFIDPPCIGINNVIMFFKGKITEYDVKEMN